jgi:hypothetical protein
MDRDLLPMSKRIILILLLLIVFSYFAGMTGSVYAEIQKSGDEQANEYKNIEEKWGIKILNIRLSAGGYMLDFRYRVKDPEKASPLFDRKIKPYLIDQASGAKFLVPESPKVGALRQTRKPVADKNYFIIFANPGKYIKKGNKVSVVIGDFKAENLTVQ